MAGSVSTVIVAIDPASPIKNCVREALRLTSSMGAELTALSVAPQYEGDLNRLTLKNTDIQLRQPFEQCLQEAADFAASCSMPIKTVLRHGNPGDEIVNWAEETEAGFIVIGSPRRNSMERVFLSRTTAGIISLSPCDVLLIPEDAIVDFSRILVCINGSKHSLDAAQRSMDLAMSYGSTVNMLTVVDLPLEKSRRYGVLKEARRKALTTLQDLAEQGKKLEVNVVTELRDGTPYKNIVTYAEENDIQLTILGSYGRTALERMFFGSIVERVTALSTCPTLIVKRLGSGGIRNLIP
jgi:nucleotide-binding universal stress UspA family protein